MVFITLVNWKRKRVTHYRKATMSPRATSPKSTAKQRIIEVFQQKPGRVLTLDQLARSAKVSSKGNVSTILTSLVQSHTVERVDTGKYLYRPEPETPQETPESISVPAQLPEFQAMTATVKRTVATEESLTINLTDAHDIQSLTEVSSVWSRVFGWNCETQDVALALAITQRMAATR